MFPVADNYINKRCGLHCREYQVENPDKKGDWGILNSKGKFTRCNSRVHITKTERAEIVAQIIDEFIRAGFANTLQHFRLKKIDSLSGYKRLIKEKKLLPNSISAQKTSKFNEILRKYMHHIYDVRDYKGSCISEMWTRECLVDVFKRLDKPNYTVNAQFSELLKYLKFTRVTLYSPIMTKSILQELMCDKGGCRDVRVFDPCIGWGGRMLGTTCLGGTYIGCEPNTKTYNGLCKMITDLDLSGCTIYDKPVEDVLDELKKYDFDICITSPPYFDLEVYTDEDSQSIVSYPDYNMWLKSFIEPIIRYISTNVHYYSCWSVKNFKTGRVYNLLDDVIRIHEEYGFTLDREYGIRKNIKSKKINGDVKYIFKPVS